MFESSSLVSIICVKYIIDNNFHGPDDEDQIDEYYLLILIKKIVRFLK